MRTLKEMIAELPAKEQRAVKARTKQLIAEEMTLQELRKKLKLTQTQMAKKMGVGQMQVSRLEKRTDLHVSTLRRVVKAMGGDLQLVVTVPGRKPVVISELDVAV